MKSILTRIALPAIALAFTAPVFAQQGAPGGSLKHPEINSSMRDPRYNWNKDQAQKPAPAAGESRDQAAGANYEGGTAIPANGTTGTSR